MSGIIRSLQRDLKGFGDDLLLAASELRGRHPGEHPDNLAAGAMAAPATPEAATAVVRWCVENDVPIVPQGGRTGLVGGSVSRPGDLILSSARLNRIEAIDPIARTAVVGAGVTAVIEDAVYAGIAEAGGSFSAEHGVGLEKRRAYLTYGNAARRTLTQTIKAALDPKNLFNPGKAPYAGD